MQINQIKININNIIFFLLLTIPLCAIAGNLLINLNILLTSIFGILLILKNKTFNLFKENPELIILTIFFLLSFLISVYLQSSILKSFLTIKFLIYTISIVFFLNNNDYAFKKILFFHSIICLILVVDVILQSYLSRNIFGIKNNFNFNSSFYGDEKLAGFHIQYFSFFVIFLMSSIFKNKFINDLFLLIIQVAIPLSIYVSLNRISIIIYFLGILIYFILIEKRKKILTIISTILFIFLATTHPDDKINEKYKSFFSHSTLIYTKFFENYDYLENIKDSKTIKNKSNNEIKNKDRYSGSGHANLFSVALHIWNENKLIGIGYKNFFKECEVLDNLICSSHPHNIYLDILLNSGLVNFINFILIIFLLFFKSMKIILSNSFNKQFTFCIFISFFTFFFPLKSAGSIYASYFGSFTFLLLGLAIYYFNKKLKN